MNQAELALWLNRRIGSWRSERRYIFNMENPKPVNLTTNFTVEQLGALRWQVTWSGQTSGVMELNLEGDLLHRSQDYFGSGAHSSRVSLIDEDTMLFHTHYDGTIFREEIKYLKADYALRQTVGFDDVTGKAKLVGQYFEVRV